ncbi:MAG TPA: hypothetical protein VG826_09040 [Pirellulales bacterium]|nr:hypothetical protein [Pirellulales bacterium]
MIFYRFWRVAAASAIGLAVAAAPWPLRAGQPSAASKPPQKDDQETAPATSFRARTNRALSAAFPAAPAERKAQAAALLSLYTQIGEAKEVIPAERSRLQARLKSRLARLADAIALDVKKTRAARQSEAGNRPSTADQPSANRSSTATDAVSSLSAPAGSSGGGPQDDGQTLVELIQATIAPQSWDVNGGAGTIVYWPAWHVLVVRQTDDVHEQIGGVVRGLRK